MIDCYNPNFPQGLSIVPNINQLPKHPSDCNGADTFGVEAQREAISRYGIAGRVWEAAYAICAYVDSAEDDPLEFDPPFLDNLDAPLTAIELGSGTGVTAASVAKAIRRAAKPGGLVIATDLPDVCPLLQHNLGIAGSGKSADALILVKQLTWGRIDHATSISSELTSGRPFTPRRLTHVVCSDLVYFPELFGPLLRTLIHLTSPPCSESPIKVVISYKIRSLPKETPFWNAFGLWFLFRPVLARRKVWPVESENVPPDSGESEPSWRLYGTDEDSDQIFVFVAHRRPESTAWDVPESDRELMEGVGARDSTARKADDTFETILFMGISGE